MRPPKAILLIDANADRAGTLRFMLWTHNYKVTAAAHPGENMGHEEMREIDLIVAVQPALDGEKAGREAWWAAFDELKKIWPRPALLLFEGNSYDPGARFDGYLEAGASAAELLERIKIMAGRKCGPKRGFFRKEGERWEPIR
ncbi:MAG: hypothetical protein WBQ94_04225 [Terracidiphilus sp.]